jgi:glycosyltransferase involved in cell wall biosynthesis
MKISLIITVFNGEKFLPKAIESFLEQDYEHKELLILDDISTDRTHEIIKSYTEKFPQFIKWIKERDSGISNARNIALKYVSGDVIGFLGADDFLHKDFFKEMVYYAKMNSNFDVIYFNSYGVGLMSGFSLSAKIPVTKRNLIKHCPLGSGESFYYRKEIFEKFQFNEKNRYSMDYELNMALVSSKKADGRKYQFYPVNITAVFNTNSGENISSVNAIKQRLETILVQLKYAKKPLEKFRILWRGKKMLARNFLQLSSVKKNFDL